MIDQKRQGALPPHRTVRKTKRTKKNWVRLEAQHELIRKVKHSIGLERERAISKLVTDHLPLIRTIVKRYRRFAADEDAQADLEQCGSLGFVDAIDRFDLRKKVFLSTFSQFYMRRAIQKYLWSGTALIRMSQPTLSKRGNVIWYPVPIVHEQQRPSETGAVMTPPGFATYRMSVKPNAHGAQRWGNRAPVLDTNENPYLDRHPSPEEQVAQQELHDRRLQVVHAVLNTLPERDRNIITERHLSTDEHVTLQQVANKHGLSKERIRQIEVKVLAKLKRKACADACNLM